MDDRKFRILQAIIDDYILTAMPVGSRTISKKYDMGLSSATIRNEMSDLEELGYLDQPHVSAGRIPSTKAYRLYVDHLLKEGLIPSGSAADIRSHFSGRMRRFDDAIDQAAKVLSELTHYTAVVMSPQGTAPIVRRLQLVPVTDTTALLVIVTDAGIVRDSVIPVSKELNADALYAISRELTERLSGKPLNEAAAILSELSESGSVPRSIYEDVNSSLQRATETGGTHVAVGGSTNMLAYPEYSDIEKARSFLSLIETRERLADIMQQSGEMAFTVRIGPETGVKGMEDCSIVTATYTTRAGRQGTIGIIGPTRMQYDRVLGILNSFGAQLTSLFSEGQLPAGNREEDQQ